MGLFQKMAEKSSREYGGGCAMQLHESYLASKKNSPGATEQAHLSFAVSMRPFWSVDETGANDYKKVRNQRPISKSMTLADLVYMVISIETRERFEEQAVQTALMYCLDEANDYLASHDLDTEWGAVGTPFQITQKWR